jgi:hypothetical protein
MAATVGRGSARRTALTPPAAPPARDAAVAESGRPLDSSTRAYMESRFAHDFSTVRTHVHPTLNASSLGARGIAIGDDIVLPRGVDPDAQAGRRLLAHELTHVVQQRGATNAHSGTASSEHEARWNAHHVGLGGLAHVGIGAPAGVPQCSTLSDEIDVAHTAGGKGKAFDVLRSRGPIAADADVTRWLDKVFGPNTDPAKTTDNRWLADQLVLYGSEPHWPHAALVERSTRARTNKWAPEPGNIEGTFDVGAGRTPIKAYYFPGTSDRRALIIGGVHGSEAAGVEVVNMLLERMRAPNAVMPFFSVIIVPALFPENLAQRRRSTPKQPDPNRQMPAVGSTPGTTDSLARPIEPENLVLLDLVERFRPERVASVHGHGAPVKGQPDMPGITTDPRPGHETDDEALALDMARTASGMPGGARVPGNRLGTKQETARYPTQAAVHQKGVTFGQYGSQAAGTRPAMNVILIETYENYTSTEPRGKKAKQARRVELESLATVLRDIFLTKL